MKILGFICLMAGVASVAGAAAVPEIDTASAGSVMAIVAGALLIYRGRRK